MNLAQISRLTSGGQTLKLLDIIDAQFSPDGLEALFESSGDLWRAEPADNPGVNFTNTPDLLETSPQWWPANPSKIVFNVMGVNEAQEKGWTDPVTGYAAMINKDGSDYVGLAEVPSLTPPALSPDGKTIAYDMSGLPSLYEIGSGKRSFDPAFYGYSAGTPETGIFFTSPSFSPDGRSLTWWVSEEAQPQRTFSLVLFDLVEMTSRTVHTYSPLSGTSGWLDAPVWSPGGQWIAFQTRSEASPWDLWIVHQGGGIGQRFGLATNPVWSPDGQHVAYVQWPPQSDSYLAASLFIIDVPAWNIQQTTLPMGSIPLAWMVPTSPASSYFPLFTPPSDWLSYSNPYHVYQIQLPPNAVLDQKAERLTISLPFQLRTQMTEKSVRVETRISSQEECYATHLWEGSTQLNGVEMRYRGGKAWEPPADGQSYLMGNYAVDYNGICFDIQSSLGVRDDSPLTGGTPLPYLSRADMDFEILLNIVSMFRVK